MMAYDDFSRQLVLFGGVGAGTSGLLGDTWTWNGTTWSEQHPSPSPGARMEGYLQYDDALGQLVLFAGQGNGYQDDTWTWDGSSWTHIPAGGPAGVSDAYASMAYHAATQKMVFLDTSQAAGSHTWTFTEHVWGQLLSVNTQWRSFESMARDDAAGTIVMFGGKDASYFLNDTWTWDGSTWTQQHPALSPPVRGGGGTSIMTYDAARHVVVLFGGIDYRNQTYSDTWTWDGSSWTRAG